MITFKNDIVTYKEVLDMKYMGFGVRINGDRFWNKEEMKLVKEFRIIEMDPTCNCFYLETIQNTKPEV